jgi:uncharacterized cupredoxin-like copper-binding protein
VERTRAAIAVTLLALTLLGGSLIGAGRPGLAQDQNGTPEAAIDPVDVSHPAFVQTGGCDEPGDTVEPLSDLTRTPGETVGAAGAIVTSRSFTEVPIALDALLAEDFSINVHRSAQEIDTYLACGEIGGILDPGGALTIGLRDIAGSGHRGIAYLAPGADPATTGILIFMTEDEVTDRAGADATPVAGEATEGDQAIALAAETPAPTEDPTEETVEVSLTEWLINMPTELEAGEVIFEVINDGTVPHTFQITGGAIDTALAAPIGPGETGRLTVELAPGTYTAFCPLGDGAHREIGMQLEFTVE